MKSCTKCGESKPLSEYYKQADKADGHRKECKECHRVASRRNSIQTRDIRAYRLKHNIHFDPRKNKARQMIANHIRLGNLTRPESCSECNKPCKPHGHHDNYNHGLDVRWLCSVCHGEWHSNNKAV